jgi:hypothetical protein
LPDTILVGEAVSVATGTGCVTVTTAEAVAVPPFVPGQVTVYVTVAVGCTATDPPLVGLTVPTLLLMEQLDAFVEDHVRFDALPETILVGFALNAAVGAGVTVTVAVAVFDPPAPVQVIV